MSKKQNRRKERKEQKRVENEQASLRKQRRITDEDFARADRLMKERERYFAEIKDAVIKRFQRPWWTGLLKWFAKPCPLHSLYLFTDSTADFRAYVFLERKKDIKECQANGVCKAIEDYLYQQFERYGHGRRGEIEIAMEWDSDEAVRKEFNGNYIERLQ